MRPMQQPHAKGYRDEDGQHDQPERAGNVAENSAEGVSEKEADRDKARCPQSGGEEIQPHKAVPANRAQSQRERRKIAHPVDEAERQDEAGIVALEPVERDVNPMAPPREPVEQPHPATPAEPEIALFAAEAAEPCGSQQQ